MQSLSLKRVVIPARNNKTRWDLEVKNGAIQTIRPSDQQQTEPEVTSDMLLPALCHPHIHLDKPYILTCNHSPSRHHPDYSDLAPTSGSFGEALTNTSEAKKRYTRDDLYMRGAQLLAASYRQGVTSLRAFVEIDHVTDTLALETAIKLKDEFAHLVTVQICAFAQDPVFSGDFGAQNREAIQSALSNFAHAIDVLGTTPYVEKAREAAAENIEWAVKTALANDLHLDFHLDYNLEPSSSLQPLTYTVIDVLQKHQWANEADKSKTIVLGHCTQLSTICASELEDLAEKIKESKLPVHFVGLPTSDLFMMGRPDSGNASSKPHSRPRGTLQVPSLIKNYGLSACLGVNNVGNAFTPFGSGDPLQLASWGVGIYQAGTVDDARVLHDDGDIIEGDNWHPMLLVKNEQSLSLPAKLGVPISECCRYFAAAAETCRTWCQRAKKGDGVQWKLGAQGEFESPKTGREEYFQKERMKGAKTEATGEGSEARKAKNRRRAATAFCCKEKSVNDRRVTVAVALPTLARAALKKRQIPATDLRIALVEKLSNYVLDLQDFPRAPSPRHRDCAERPPFSEARASVPVVADRQISHLSPAGTRSHKASAAQLHSCIKIQPGLNLRARDNLKPVDPLPKATLALSQSFGEATEAVAKMAQPTAEPVEDYDYEALPPNFSLAQNMVAGAFAGIATRMQIVNSSTAYKGMVDGTMRIAAGEGILKLWRGMSSVVVGAGPAHAVYFATYEAVKHAMGGNQVGVHHPLAAATSGAAATIASDAFMNPFDAHLSAVIKQRMQIKNSSKMYRSMWDCARYVYRNEGLSAFYVSYPTTLSMTVPFTALQFLAYESISTSMNPDKKYDPITHCTAGAVAGGFAAALTTPMDVIKTMLQTRGSATDPELRSVNGFMAGCRLMYRREGMRGFFKGVKPRIVTTMPSTAICWSAYEFSKTLLDREAVLAATGDETCHRSRICRTVSTSERLTVAPSFAAGGG
ncbi:hypothetical protein SCUP515_06023 [Seiridium cupressi]